MNGKEIAKLGLDTLMAIGADRAQCVFSQKTKHELNIEAGKISLLRTMFDSEINYKLIKDSRQGKLLSNKTDKTSIEQSAKKVMELSQGGNPDSAYDIASRQSPKEFVSGPQKPDLDRMYDQIQNFLEVTKKKYPKTIIEGAHLDFSHNNSYFVNSNGVDFITDKGLYNFMVLFTSKDGQKTSSFNYTNLSFKELQKELIDSGSIDRLLRESNEQIDVKLIHDKFKGEVLITPECFSAFLHYLCTPLQDMRMIADTSIFKDKLNKSITSDKFSLHSRPRSEEIANNSFVTPDGFEVQNSTIVDKGILKTFLLSQYGANKTGLARSVNLGGALVVDPGDQALNDQIKSIKKGIILGRFSGGYPSESGEFSGVAKSSYYVEDGQIKYPIGETMVSGNYVDMFNRILSVSRERIDFGNNILPWLLTEGVTISGK